MAIIILCSIVCPFARSGRCNEFIVGRTQLDTSSLTRQTEPLYNGLFVDVRGGEWRRCISRAFRVTLTERFLTDNFICRFRAADCFLFPAISNDVNVVSPTLLPWPTESVRDLVNLPARVPCVISYQLHSSPGQTIVTFLLKRKR